jgi:hypothetical protein
MIKNVFARYLALLLIGGALIGGAAVALAGMASAQTTSTSGYNYAPTVKVHAAPTQQPGWHHHHGVWHIESLAK